MCSMEMKALPTPSLASRVPGEWLLTIRAVFTLLLMAPTASESSCHKESKLTSYGTGTLNRPAGIAIDGAGYIAISEHSGNNNCLWIFSPDHNLVHTLSGQFSSGLGIACDLEGNF